MPRASRHYLPRHIVEGIDNTPPKSRANSRAVESFDPFGDGFGRREPGAIYGLRFTTEKPRGSGRNGRLQEPTAAFPRC